MSYQVIARKYRPQRFNDVVGQEHVTQTLTNAIQRNRIAHAYLFVGPRGTGKTTLARIFAKCLNCTGGPKVDFPDEDPRCKEIAEGRALDVLEIDGASNRGIDEIRELRETVKYAPATSRYKIYIIDEVHMLTKEAFNALLKTLEEPPEHVKFMFATTEPEKVLTTILSRCQRFDLRRIPSALIVKHLGWIAQQEKVEIDEATLYAIARGADGGMRDAESTLDQLISFCGGKIVETDVLAMFGLTARSQILALARAILNCEIETALRELNELAKNGKDLGRLLSDLLNHFRNLLLHQVSKGDLSLIEASEAEAGALAEQAALANQDALTRIMEIFAECEGRLRDAASKKILIEVALLKAVQARNALPIDTVLKKLRELRDGTAHDGRASSAPPLRPAVAAPSAEVAAPGARRASPSLSAPPDFNVPPAATGAALRESTPVPATNGPTTALAGTPEPIEASTHPADLEVLWLQILEAVGRVSAFSRSYLLEAHPVSLARNVFTIGFDPEFADHLGLVDNAKTRVLLQTKLKELGHGEVQIKFVNAEAPPGRVRSSVPNTPAATTPNSSGSAPAQANMLSAAQPTVAEPKREKTAPTLLNKEDFKNDPLIREALEVFKGTIVEVRA